MNPARFSFVKLFVADLDAMIAFYSAAFDMTVHVRIEEPDFEEVLLRQEGQDFLLGLFRWKDGRDRDARPTAGVVGFVTQNVHVSVAQAIEAGAHLRRAPFDTPGTRVALADDPEGHEIEFVQFL